RPHKLDLQVLTRLSYADAVFLAEAIEQLNALFEHAVPAVTLGVVQRLLLVLRPFAVKSYGCIFLSEVGAECLFEGAPEEHGGPGVLLLPAVEITMTIPARAAQIMADLTVAVGHDAALASPLI